MTPRLADAPKGNGSRGATSAKHVFDRDPLLIPSYSRPKPPVYRRRKTYFVLLPSVLFVLATAFAIQHFTVERVLRVLARVLG